MNRRFDGIRFRSRDPISHWVILAGIVRDQGGEDGSVTSYTEAGPVKVRLPVRIPSGAKKTSLTSGNGC